MPFVTPTDFMRPRAVLPGQIPGAFARSSRRDVGGESFALSYRTARRPQEALYGLSGLGSQEVRELEKLPPRLVEAIVEESDDPEFIQETLIPALKSANPYEYLIQDITEQTVEELSGVSDDFGLGKKKKRGWKKLMKKHKKVFKGTIKKARKAKNKVTPKFMRKIQKKVHKVGKKVWRQYGGIIISVVGAVLAPFTGGASIAAAAVLSAAHTMYYKKKAADEAKKAGKADANLMKAEAQKQEAEMAAQVDQFYRDNEAWFLQYDLTPEKWAKLSLDDKIKFIEAGVKGTLPPGTTLVEPTQQQVQAQTQATQQAAASAGIPPAAVAPVGAPAGAGYPTSDGGAPPPGDPAAAREYTIIVEGRELGRFQDFQTAVNAVLEAAQPGDRFEILADGKSLGLAVRTAEGSVDVPPEAEAKMREMTPEQVRAVVNKADAEVAGEAPPEGVEEEKKGGFPWLLLLGGAAVAVAASQ